MLNKGKVMHLFQTEKVVEKILSVYKKDDTGETEGDTMVDMLIEQIQASPSVQVFKEFAEITGYEYS